MTRKEALGLMAGFPFLGMMPTPSPQNPTAFLDGFIPRWETAFQYGQEIIDAMPANSFGYKPQADMTPFGEMMVHTASSTQFLFKPFLQLDPLEKPNSLNKEAITAYFQAIQQRSTEALRNLYTKADALAIKGQHGARFLADHTGQDLILRAYMHIAHHRGMAVVYLRMQGIEPPRFQY